MTKDEKLKIQEPCLLKAVEEQELVARRFGFYWEKIDQLIEQIQSECAEIVEAHASGDREHLKEEIGDLMQAAVSLCVFCDLDPRETMRAAVDKFQRRYDAVVSLAKKDGLDNLHEQTFTDVLLHYWKEAKKLTKKNSGDRHQE